MKQQTINPKLLIAMGLLVLAAGYMLLIRPQGSRLNDARDERANAEQQLSSARALASTPTTVVAAEPTAAELAVPEDPALPGLLRQLESIAAESGLRHTTVTPGKVALVEGLPGGSLGLTIEAKGTQAGAYVYLNRLATLPRLVVVEQVGISAGASADPAAASAVPSGEVTLELLARAFTSQTPVGPAS